MWLGEMVFEMKSLGRWLVVSGLGLGLLCWLEKVLGVIGMI